jgi:uncharacterized protein
MAENVFKDISCCGETLSLSNQRALFWGKERTLVIADLHLGKTAHFRKHGIAIPLSVMERDLQRLKNLIVFFGARNLIVVGDMFHSGYNTDLAVFKRWRDELTALEIHLVKGNHDRLSEEQYAYLGINSSAHELLIPPFHFVHHAQANKPFSIGGHLHPGRVIYGMAKQAVRLPCFILNEHQLILPAFSLFTGLDTQNEPLGNNTYYLLTEKAVFEI